MEIWSTWDGRRFRATNGRSGSGWPIGPRRVLGQRRAMVAPSVTGTDELTGCWPGADAIGYSGKPIPDLPFDEQAALCSTMVDGLSTQVPASWCPAHVAGWTAYHRSSMKCPALCRPFRRWHDFNDGRLTDPVAPLTALDQLAQAQTAPSHRLCGMASTRLGAAATAGSGKQVHRSPRCSRQQTSAPKEPLRRARAGPAADLGSFDRANRPLWMTWRLGSMLTRAWAQRPVVAERVGDHPAAVSPELVLQGGHHRGARVQARWNLASTSVTSNEWRPVFRPVKGRLLPTSAERRR